MFAIVPAAGSGTRMGSEKPKLLLPLGGRLLIQHTIDALTATGLLQRIVILAPQEWLDAFQTLDWRDADLVEVIAGGASRSDSVRCGLRAIAAQLADGDDPLVLVHDGARCLIDGATVARAVDAAARYGAVTTAVPAIDSLTRVDGEGVVTEALDRSTVWCVQTPQVFRLSLLARAHASNEAATDDASLVQKIHPVRIVEGARRNYKITTPEDYALAEVLMRQGY